MKKMMMLVCLIGLLLAGCGQSTAALPTATDSRLSETPTASPTSSTLPTATLPVPPSATPSPTWAPPPDLPAVPEKMAAHKLALNEFNTGTGMKRLNIYGTGKLNNLTFSPDGKYLATATGRGIFLYDGQTFKQTSFIDVNDAVDAIAFSPDEPVLAAAARGKVSLWNVLSAQKLTTLEGEFISISALAYGKGGHVAATGSDCRGCGIPVLKMTIWDVKTGKQIYVEKETGYGTLGLVFTQDGNRLAYGGDGGLSLWDVQKKDDIVIPDPTHSGRSSDAVNSPLNFIFNTEETALFVLSQDTKYDPNQTVEIASGKRNEFDLCDSNLTHSQTLGGCFKNGNIILFDLSNGQKVAEIAAPDLEKNWGREMTLSPNGETIAYTFKDLVHVVNVKTGQEIKTLTFTTFDNIQNDMVWFNGQLTYVAAIPNERGQVDLVNLEDGTHLQTYALAKTQIKDLAFRPDHKTVATLDETNTLTLWDIQTQRILYQTTFSTYLLPPFTFSPNGLELFFITPDNDILMLEQFSGTLQKVGRNSYAYDFADPYVHNNYHFNLAGHLLLLDYTDDHYPAITDLTQKQTTTVPFETINKERYLEIEAYDLNPDEKLITFGTTRNIFVWNTETLQQVSMLTGHEAQGGDGFYGMIQSVAFSLQSDLLVSVGWDGTTRLWNVHAGQELRRLNVCCQAAFTPDGRYLLTAGEGVLRVWGIP